MFGKSLLKRDETKVPATTNGNQQQNQDLDRPIRSPAVSLRETDDAILVEADFPGVKADQVQVTVNQGVLTLRGTTGGEPRSGFQLVYQEYAEGDFQRSFTLPSEIDTEGIKATSKNGVLTLTLPKAKEAQPRRIAVNAS
jgi:HSP20 family molecular chaperone IbpA